MGTQTMPRNPGAPRQAPDRRTPPERTAPERTPPERTPSGRTPPASRAATVTPAKGAQAAPGRPRPGARPITAPRHTRPVTGPVTRPVTTTVPGTVTGPVTGPVARPAPRRTARGARRSRPRTPFLLLLVGLLGGALVSLLVISTTLAQGAFQITSLQQQNTNLARQQQTLTDEVAQAGNPSAIASEAAKLGMRQNPDLKFIDTKTGKIVTGKVTKSDAAYDAPGYTP
jgi:hypothetical protein